MKYIYLNPTFQEKPENSNQYFKLNNIIEYTKVNNNIFNEIPKPITNYIENIISFEEELKIKPIKKFPTLSIDLIKKTEKILNPSEEEYDESIPRAEIISLIDFYPLVDDNNNQTVAGKHFKYQLLYLNANRISINNELKKYFSQSQKDVTYLQDFNKLVSLINDKNLIDNKLDLYNQDYFSKLITLTDYSLKQTTDFYLRISKINSYFSDKQNSLNLVKNLKFKLNNNTNIQKIYGLLLLHLEEKLFLKSKKLYFDQTTTLEKSIIFDIKKEDSLKSFPIDYKNIKVNDNEFINKIPYFKYKNFIDRSKYIIEDLIFESYKDQNKDLCCLNFDNYKQGFINIDSLSFDQNQYNLGLPLTILTNFPKINDNDIKRFLFELKEKDQYIFNVMQNIISSNFDEKYVSLITNEININQNKSFIKNSKFSNLFNVNSLNKFQFQLDRGVNNEPPRVDYLIRHISNFLNKININNINNNFNSIILELEKLISFYYEQVKICKNSPIKNINVNSNNIDFKFVVDNTDGFINKNETALDIISSKVSINNENILPYADALRLIHFNVLEDDKIWKDSLKISPQYVPFGDGKESVLNFIGFLTYLFKRTSQNPGQTDLSYDAGNIFGNILIEDEEKINNLKSNYKLTYKRFNKNLFNASIICNDSGDLSQSYWLCFMELLKTIKYSEYECSSLKNPFYKAFSDCFINILKSFKINDDIIKNEIYNYNDNLNINEEHLYLMFDIFISIVDIIKELFHYEAKTIHREISNLLTKEGNKLKNKQYQIDRILISNDCIGIGNAISGEDNFTLSNLKEGIFIFSDPYYDGFPEDGSLNSDLYKETGKTIGTWVIEENNFSNYQYNNYRNTDLYFNNDKPVISSNKLFNIFLLDTKQLQHFIGLDINFKIDDQIKEFKTITSEWKSNLENYNNIYNFLKNRINEINNDLQELRNIDYDFLSTQINSNFKLNKRSLFMSKYQLSDIKRKYDKIIKYNNNDYLIEDIIDDKYENIITTSINKYKDKSKNAKILTFGYPLNAEDARDINVEIHRKNLIHQDLIFKPIIKNFNLNLFCNITNLFELNDTDINVLVQKAKYYEFKNKELILNQINDITKIDNEILTNHYYSEILSHYLKIMTGLEINDYTLVENYPPIDSEIILNNISNIIYNNDQQKTEKQKKLLTIQNKISTFISPLDFRTLIYSNSIFERIYSTLIDPDDFEIDTSNWVNKGWMLEKSLLDITFTNILQDYELESRIQRDKLPFKINIIHGKIYLDDDDNISDSYKIKIDKKV